MRKVLPLIVMIVLPAVFLIEGMSCQKVKVVPPPASFTVINAMATSNPIVPRLGRDTAGRYYNDPTGNSMIQLGYGRSQLYSPVGGTVPCLVVPRTDTMFKIFNGNLNLESGGIYSFFLSGDTAHADTMIVRDDIPYYGDSSVGARFVNLSIGGKAITVTLMGDNPNNLQFPAIGYQGITNFKKYNAGASAGGNYQFVIRDQATGDSLTSYFWSYTLYKNNTIVISGSPDPLSQTPLNVFSVNNY